mmetsp:Transcript_50980/g.95602  ORF Transcript_50980/g.95602 Transcript_50980/m.95602 type:complete len:81 (+) Transcript_50980:1359-1601(+)
MKMARSKVVVTFSGSMDTSVAQSVLMVFWWTDIFPNGDLTLANGKFVRVHAVSCVGRRPRLSELATLEIPEEFGHMTLKG